MQLAGRRPSSTRREPSAGPFISHRIPFPDHPLPFIQSRGLRPRLYTMSSGGLLYLKIWGLTLRSRRGGECGDLKRAIRSRRCPRAYAIDGHLTNRSALSRVPQKFRCAAPHVGVRPFSGVWDRGEAGETDVRRRSPTHPGRIRENRRVARRTTTRICSPGLSLAQFNGRWRTSGGHRLSRRLDGAGDVRSASLLRDAYIELDEALIDRLINRYLDQIGDASAGVDQPRGLLPPVRLHEYPA